MSRASAPAPISHATMAAMLGAVRARAAARPRSSQPLAPRLRRRRQRTAPTQPAPVAPGAPTSVTTLPGTAPTGQCDLLVTPNTDSTHFTSAKLPSGEYNNFVGGGVTGHCPVQQITLIADSAEWFGDLHMWHLIGHVHYTEPRITMDSDVATYYLTDEHLLTRGERPHAAAQRHDAWSVRASSTIAPRPRSARSRT